MPRITRVTNKIFAENAANSDIGQFGSAITGSKVTTGDIEEIQALPAWQNGWRSAVISDNNYPTLQETNGKDKVFSQQLSYIFQEGISEWDSETTYYKNSLVKYPGTAVLYYSLTDDNIGNDPIAENNNNWALYDSGIISFLPNYSDFVIITATQGTTYEIPYTGFLIAYGSGGSDMGVSHYESGQVSTLIASADTTNEVATTAGIFVEEGNIIYISRRTGTQSYLRLFRLKNDISNED